MGLPHKPPASDSFFQWNELLESPLTQAKAKLVQQFERYAICRALRRSGGNISAAARELGIHRQCLQRKIASLAITTEEFPLKTYDYR